MTWRASSCQHWWHPGAPAHGPARCWRCHIPFLGSFSPKYTHNSTVSTMAYLQQAHSSPILRKEQQQRSLSAQPCPFLIEQSVFLPSSNTPGTLQPCSSGGPWLISLFSLPKPSRAALKLLKAPQSIHSTAKSSLWAQKVRWNHRQCDSENQTTSFWDGSWLGECPDPSGTTLEIGDLGDFLLAALSFSEGWHGTPESCL